MDRAKEVQCDKSAAKAFWGGCRPCRQSKCSRKQKVKSAMEAWRCCKGKKRCTEARARVTLEVRDDEEGTWGFFPLPSRFFALHGLLRLPSQGGRLTLR